MRKLSEYVEMAAEEYLLETGRAELDSLWLAEFFQDGGVMDDFPAQNLIGFYALVQKALTLRIEKAEKLARLQQERIDRAAKG
jgi:hypothetical protein